MKNIRIKLHEIIFGSDTKSGKIFDVILLILIASSVIIVMFESVDNIKTSYGNLLNNAEWIITIIFTIEYILRIWIVKKASVYIKSFFGVIDLLAILPVYLSLFFVGPHGLLVIRGLRLLRIFRIFKLTRYTAAGKTIIYALQNSWAKIGVFLFGILMITIILGTIMYLIEGEQNGFSSIPKGIYWAIVTITTVGYGDLAPQTSLGQVFASFAMILGYAIIAVPTGIVTAEFTIERLKKQKTKVCSYCSNENHENDADFCKYCGEKLI
jgi:voltage-gated potassium channel